MAPPSAARSSPPFGQGRLSARLGVPQTVVFLDSDSHPCVLGAYLVMNSIRKPLSWTLSANMRVLIQEIFLGCGVVRTTKSSKQISECQHFNSKRDGLLCARCLHSAARSSPPFGQGRYNLKVPDWASPRSWLSWIRILAHAVRDPILL